ncbi:Tm-1-like ATP-binding domain-containing protein [Actinomadura viridis]|uniref:Tm-1-like ATP-binding domain-containing protein n=1 Tax=Actinomadura viridis TaxID=58110 RepID=UPI00369F6595
MPVVVLIGMLDARGLEHAWIRDRLKTSGAEAILVDTGPRDVPRVTPDITREEVLRAAGVDPAVRTGRDGTAAAMARGAAEIARRLHRTGRLHGVLALGGGSVTAAALGALPPGVPKLVVSGVASGDAMPSTGGSGTALMYAAEPVSARVLAGAADAITGMAGGVVAGRPSGDAAGGDRSGADSGGAGPLVGATLASGTAPGVHAARELLGILGYEVAVFRATAAGRRSYESMAAGGTLTAALDATLADLSIDLPGGLITEPPTRPPTRSPTGPTTGPPRRLEGAARSGIPQVVSLGGLDVARFAAAVPLPARRARVRDRAGVLVRPTPAESADLGRRVAARLRESAAPAALFVPLCGLSTLSAPGGPLHDPAADAALFAAVREGLSGSAVAIHEMDTHFNDPAFGRAMADRLHTILSGFRVHAVS